MKKRRFEDCPPDPEDKYHDRRRDEVPQSSLKDEKSEAARIWHYTDSDGADGTTYGPFSKANFRMWFKNLEEDKEYEEYKSFASMLAWKEGDAHREEISKILGLPKEHAEQKKELKEKPALKGNEVTNGSADKLEPKRDPKSAEVLKALRREIKKRVKQTLEKTREWNRKQITREEFTVCSTIFILIYHMPNCLFTYIGSVQEVYRCNS